ncbi:hypothetical protein [Hyphomonas polymorpha]|nr:hypothetical protein [Hyphomonas polymorpha]
MKSRFSMYRSYIMAAVASFFLSACASQVRETYAFNATSANALVMIGVKSEVGPYGITFNKMDSATCEVHPLGLGRSFDHNAPFSPTAYRASGPHYILASFEPGDWVIASMSYQAGVTRAVRFDERGFAFNAKPGEFIYVGDIVLTRNDIQFEGRNRAHALSYLQDYPDIAVAPTDAPHWLTPFRRGAPEPNCRTSSIAQ